MIRSKQENSRFEKKENILNLLKELLEIRPLTRKTKAPNSFDILKKLSQKSLSMVMTTSGERRLINLFIAQEKSIGKIKCPSAACMLFLASACPVTVLEAI